MRLEPGIEVISVRHVCGVAPMDARSPFQHRLRQPWFVWVFVMVIAVVMAGSVSNSVAAENRRTLGETVYVPAYSRIHTQDRRDQPLASTLVVHNIDPSVEIGLLGVAYYDHTGQKLQDFVSEPLVLKPFESRSFLTPISESAGGVGANYIVEWEAQEPALSPLAEAVMIGGTGTHGISFTVRGTIIDQKESGTHD